MPENIEQIIRLAIIIIDAIAVITLVCTILKGLFQGVYKFLYSSGIKWGLTLILILFSKTIAESLLTASYPGIGPLDVYLLNFACESLQLDYATLEASYSYALLYGLILSTVRLVIILLTSFIVTIIVCPIIKFILNLFGLKKLVNNLPRTIFVRFLGVISAVLVYAIFFTITYLPYYGAINIAINVTEDISSLSKEETINVENESMLDINLEDYIDSSFIYPYFSSEDSIAVEYLNSLYVVELNEKNIYLINEYYNIRELLPIVVDNLIHKDETKNLPTVEEFKTITNILKESEFTEFIVPVAIEVCLAKNVFDKYEIELSFDALHEVDWVIEKQKLDKVIENLNDFYVVAFDHQDNLKGMFASDEFVQVVPDLVKSLFDLYLLREYGVEILNVELENYINDNPSDLTEILELVKIEEIINSDLTKILTVVKELSSLGIFDEDFSIENLNISSEDQINSVLQQLFSLSFIENNEEKIFEFLIKTLDLNTKLEEMNLTVSYNNIVWETEITNISHLIFIMYKNPDIFESISDPSAEGLELTKDLLSTILNLDLINKSVPSLINGLFDSMELNDWKSSWLEDQQSNFSKEDWQDELNNLLDFVLYFKENNVDFSDITNAEVEEIHELLLKVSALKSITLEPVVDILNSELNSFLNTDETYLVINSELNWENELDLIFGHSGIFEQIQSISTDSTFKEYGKLIDKMNESTLFNPAINKIIREFIKGSSVYKTTENPQGILTDEDIADGVLDTVTSWENELKLLDEVDLESATQDGKTIDILMQSVLLKRQVEVYISNIIDENNLSDYYLLENIHEDIEDVNEYIALTKQDSDETNDYSWEKEVNNLTLFSQKLTEIKEGNISISAITELKNIAESGIITAKIFEEVKEKEPIINDLL